ncbi:MAG: HDIG domain-containing protein [Bacteroidales bacterium]|nr:HDIG domain-containing protein [Bacteroidales bacterium]
MNAIELIDKYYASEPELKELLLAHSQQVASRALSIAKQQTSAKLDLAFIEEAALLHDIGIIYCNAPGIHCHGTHQYIEHGYLGAQLLKKEGFPRHAEVARRHTGTGITMKQIIQRHLPIPPGDYLPRTMEEQIICYADKFYSKTHIGEETPLPIVRKKLEKFGKRSVHQFDKWQKRFEPELSVELMIEAD